MINGIIHVAITIVVFPTCLSWDEPSIVIFMFLWRGYLEDKIIVETRDSTKNFNTILIWNYHFIRTHGKTFIAQPTHVDSFVSLLMKSQSFSRSFVRFLLPRNGDSASSNEIASMVRISFDVLAPPRCQVHESITTASPWYNGPNQSWV